MFMSRALPGPLERKPTSADENGDLHSKREKRQSLGNSNGGRGFGWRPESFLSSQHQHESFNSEKSQPSRRRSSTDRAPPKQPAVFQIELRSERSTPVAVPPRRGLSSAPRTALLNENRSRKNGSRRDSTRCVNIPPPSAPVAALLETTSIPKRTSFRKPQSIPRRMSTQELMDEWSKDETFSGSSITSSPTMDFLLSPPQKGDHLARSESNESFGLLSRSTSTDSVPSLGPDENSHVSWSLSSTPSASLQRRCKDKLQSPREKLCEELEHPLSPLSNCDDEDLALYHPKAGHMPPTSEPVVDPSIPTASLLQPSRARKPSNFKSNLTTSLNNLRNSIRSSLSNFSAPAPYVLSDDHLYRGFLSGSPIPIRSEMRPRPLDGPVTPEMRRYMNPSSYHVSPQYASSPGLDFHMHCHGRFIEHIDLEAAAATSPGLADQPLPTMMDRDSVIPLQTYERCRSKQNSSAPGSTSAIVSIGQSKSITEADRLGTDHRKPQYRRELRENGEFLRVCILEMNMRRAGKLSDGPGRARLWLPPRCETEETSNSRADLYKLANGKKIPRRWVPISA